MVECIYVYLTIPVLPGDGTCNISWLLQLPWSIKLTVILQWRWLYAVYKKNIDVESTYLKYEPCRQLLNIRLIRFPPLTPLSGFFRKWGWPSRMWPWPFSRKIGKWEIGIKRIKINIISKNNWCKCVCVLLDDVVFFFKIPYFISLSVFTKWRIVICFSAKFSKIARPSWRLPVGIPRFSVSVRHENSKKCKISGYFQTMFQNIWTVIIYRTTYRRAACFTSVPDT